MALLFDADAKGDCCCELVAAKGLGLPAAAPNPEGWPKPVAGCCAACAKPLGCDAAAANGLGLPAPLAWPKAGLEACPKAGSDDCPKDDCPKAGFAPICEG